MHLLKRIRSTMVLVLLSRIVCVASGQECFDDGNEFCIDEDDILSVDLLPGSFLFADQQVTKITTNVSDNETTDGSIRNALNEMDYHRKKMNEYLCHGYMAEEIVQIMSTSRVKRRLNLADKNDLQDSIEDDNVTIHDKLLADEGSSKYKNWLQRRTTLEDVYRHYAPQKKLKRKQGDRDDNFEEFDGEVTGYAMQAPLPSGKVGFYEEQNEEDDHMLSSSSGHNFYYGHPFGHQAYGHQSYGHGGEHYLHHTEAFPAIHEEHYYSAPAPYYQDHEEDYHKAHYSKGKGNDLSIKDFFEIALTALAFLAFGLFIIQLLMNATSNMNATMPPMIRTGKERLRRNIGGLPLAYESNEELNELSYNVLRSIEAALVAEADSGTCLRRILCENNKRSTKMADARKLWIPVWSLGMSWISGRVLKGSPWSAIRDSVKASVLGLGGADCPSLYPDCDLKKERIKRRRRRRK